MPYFDLTIDVVKSVSVLHAPYRVSACQARERGEHDQAAALDARADEIEAAVLDAARESVGWLERHATYTRTGHHSARTGEWRDGDGLVASLFLHHISRDGDPHLHVHVAVWNRVQRACQPLPPVTTGTDAQTRPGGICSVIGRRALLALRNVTGRDAALAAHPTSKTQERGGRVPGFSIGVQKDMLVSS